MVSSVGAASSSVASNSSAAAGGQSLAANFETFLKLLTTQLQHQDPLQPMDSDKFTQQLVSFAGVEQQIGTNTNLEHLVSMMTSSQTTAASGLIGKTVEATGNVATVGSKGATWAYDLPSTASKLTVSVLDSTGRSVFSKELKGDDLKSGTHTFEWDGRDNGGTMLSPGSYSLKVTALDASEKGITAKLSVNGIVDGVETANGQTMLLIGSRKVRLEDISSVRQTATN